MNLIAHINCLKICGQNEKGRKINIFWIFLQEKESMGFNKYCIFCFRPYYLRPYKKSQNLVRSFDM